MTTTPPPTTAPAWLELELNRDVWRAYAVDLSAPLRERINAALSLARKHYGGTSG